MFEVVPEPLGVEQLQFGFLVPRQVAQPPIVEQQPPVLIHNAHRGRTILQDFVKLPPLFLDLMLVPRERRDVVDPEHALAADEADMPSRVGDLRVGQQHVNGLAVLGPPDRLFVQQLPTPFAQQRDHSRALLAVVPEYAGIDAVEFFLAAAEQLAQPRVVEHQPSVVVDDHQLCRTELQQFAELALVLGRLDPRSGATIGRRRSACCRIRRHALFPRSIAANASIEGPNSTSEIGPMRSADVACGSKADMCGAKGHVRFTPESGHVRCN